VKGWFSIYEEDGLVILDVFPWEPGGATLRLTGEVALWLSERLKEEAQKVRA